MGAYAWLIVFLIAITFAASRAAPIWMDGQRRAMPLLDRTRWAVIGIVAPSRYWWGARIDAMPPDEQAELLARETAKLGLRRAAALHCPLCGAEITNAWALTSDGRPTVAVSPVHCPQCDFRLDACRHCAHFIPGSARAASFDWGGGEMTFGRCGFYKRHQPVEQICPPEIAKRLKERGYESFNAPLPILDSFVPPDFCRAFHVDRKRLEASGVRWPDARGAALLRLLLARPSAEATSSKDTTLGDEKWLM